MNNKLCPCGTGQSYVDCCGALHSGARTAATAEQLMRSRYSAFA
ncbi:MAG TPA: SEC-C metal-binding domain-containing protein, partial [Lentzea sp.]